MLLISDILIEFTSIISDLTKVGILSNSRLRVKYRDHNYLGPLNACDRVRTVFGPTQHCVKVVQSLVSGVITALIKNPDSPLKKMETIHSQRHMQPLCIAASFLGAKTCRQLENPSIREWIKEMWCIYTMEY